LGQTQIEAVARAVIDLLGRQIGDLEVVLQVSGNTELNQCDELRHIECCYKRIRAVLITDSTTIEWRRPGWGTLGKRLK